eukprot:scaffold84798_cov41-Prasinocladus_malaysianus.AAC.1
MEVGRHGGHLLGSKALDEAVNHTRALSRAARQQRLRIPCGLLQAAHDAVEVAVKVAERPGHVQAFQPVHLAGEAVDVLHCLLGDLHQHVEASVGGALRPGARGKVLLQQCKHSTSRGRGASALAGRCLARRPGCRPCCVDSCRQSPAAPTTRTTSLRQTRQAARSDRLVARGDRPLLGVPPACGWRQPARDG